MPSLKITCAISCALLTSLSTMSAFAQERATTPDLKRARELDQQGSRAFKDGRFKDAITFFGEAFRYGAPPVELWNIAKCHLKLDEPEAAEESFRQFLVQPDLTAQDRGDASEQLNELRGRPSTLAIDSDPSGATFTIDGSAQARGTTPGSIDIPPGKHLVHVEKEKVGAYDVEVVARLGRALIVQGHLAQNSGSVTSNEPGTEHATSAKPIGLVFSEDFGFFASKLGSYADNVRPVLHLAARYVFRDVGIVSFSGGLRFDVTTDGWPDVILPTAAPPTNQPVACDAQQSYSGTELAGFLVGGIQAHVSSRIRVGGDIGVGLADFEGSPTGGEAFLYDCNPSYGLRPAFHVGTEASIALTPYGPFRVRALIEPILFQAHAAYHDSSVEASSLWWRIGSAFGFAFDF